ncbi:unnamed protein product, partial [Ilex paraguariensis]
VIGKGCLIEKYQNDLPEKIHQKSISCNIQFKGINSIEIGEKIGAIVEYVVLKLYFK